MNELAESMTRFECDCRGAEDVLAELNSARKKFGPMHGPHEGYAVLLEEMDELWDEVKRHTHDRGRMRVEAIQVAAMAIRFVTDVCCAPQTKGWWMMNEPTEFNGEGRSRLVEMILELRRERDIAECERDKMSRQITEVHFPRITELEKRLEREQDAAQRSVDELDEHCADTDASCERYRDLWREEKARAGQLAAAGKRIRTPVADGEPAVVIAQEGYDMLRTALADTPAAELCPGCAPLANDAEADA